MSHRRNTGVTLTLLESKHQEVVMQNTEAKIVSVEITPADSKAGRYQASATAQFDDGTSDLVLEWYDDELSFTEREFIGRTRHEVNRLFLAKDQAYLRS